jgi:flavin-dependent dehydrogenase
MYKCLPITGGAGFAGSSLAISLKQNAAADSVVVLDKLPCRRVTECEEDGRIDA